MSRAKAFLLFIGMALLGLWLLAMGMLLPALLVFVVVFGALWVWLWGFEND